jgi:hypothetical protein
VNFEWQRNEKVCKRVCRAVSGETNGDQTPWNSSSPIGTISPYPEGMRVL